jgi:hypothetical protein
MTTKNSYWIRDVEGVFALVDGADERDQWTKVHGWAEADEPGPTDQVHVVNEHPEIAPGRLPYGAVADWSGLGWKAGPPPSDAPTNPDLGDQAASPKATAPVAAKPANSGDKKE